MAAEAASLLLGCVTGTDTYFRLVERDPCLPGHVRDTGKR